MIEIVQVPDRFRVIADGNDTLIKLQANPNGGYFVRAKIYVDDLPDPFLVQGWSKDDAGLCEFNLKHLYYSYFVNTFSSAITTGFNPKPGLFKKIKIIAEEYLVGGTVPVATLNLPEFYLIKNLRPYKFEDSKTVSFLDLPQENINVDRESGFVFPLFLKAGAALTVDILDQLGAVLYTTQLLNYSTQLTQYEMLFSDYDLSANQYVFIRFATSQDAVQKKLIFVDANIFPPKNIFYENNSGFFVTACLTGRKAMEHSLSPKSYTQLDGTDITYEVEDTRELELSSGFGYKDITSLIHSIATSVDVRIQLDGFWERVKSGTTKITRFVDNQFIYGDALKFSRLNIPNFTNENAYALIPEIVDISISGDENTQLEILPAQFFTAYSAVQPATRIRIGEVPINGLLSFEDGTGVVPLSDMVANDPAILPYDIPLAGLVRIIYDPNQRAAGSPLDSLDFQMGPSEVWSNVAQLNFEVIDIPDADLPPEIIVNSLQYAALDVSNNGSAFINAIINVAAGHGLTILWTVIGGAPITFDNNAIEKPTITLTGAADNTVYQIKVTATDTTNTFVAEKTINISTSSYSVKVLKTEYAPSPSTAKKVDINFSGGQAFGTVTFKRTVWLPFTVIGISGWVLYNYQLAAEEILYGGINSGLTIALDASGTAIIPCQLNSSSGLSVGIIIEITAVDGVQIIDPVNYTVTATHNI